MASLLAALQCVSITDNFLTTLNKCRNVIKTKFKQISDKLIIRQNLLLVELDEIEKRYTETERIENILNQAKEAQKEQKSTMERMSNILSNDAISAMKLVIEKLDIQIYNLRGKIEIFANTEIVLDTTNISALIETLGTVIVKQDWDYSQYTSRVICNEVQIASYPCDIVIDNNNDIYVANNVSDIISVFSMTGKCLREFGKDTLKNPCGITEHNNSLYITGNTALYKYTLAGELVKKVTCYGTDKIQFKCARGLYLNNKGLLYVCDRDNNCIPVFDENLVLQRTLSRKSIKQPLDIKTQYEQVYILTSTILHVLSEEGTYLKKIANKFNNAIFISLDGYNNVIISDCFATTTTNNVIILSLYNNNNIKRSYGNLYSVGLAVTHDNKIINLCASIAGIYLGVISS